MPRKKNQFDAFIARIDKPASIEELAVRFEARGLLTAELRDELIRDGLLARLHKAVNRDRLPSGLPRLVAVQNASADGRQLWLYKPHAALDRADFVSLFRRARNRRRRAESYEEELERVFAQRFPDDPPLRQLALTWGSGKTESGASEVA